MKRKFRSIGLFRPYVYRGKCINDERANSIYKKLIQHGFKETVWQYVYDGQIGGVVMPYLDGQYEIHVRFYDDGRIFSELEYGRSNILHFIYPLYNANRYVIKILNDILTCEEKKYLLHSMNKNLMRDDEADISVWDNAKAKIPKQYGDITKLIQKLGISNLLGWRKVLALFAAITFSLNTFIGMNVFLVTAPMLLLLTFFVPTIGKP